MMIGSDPVAMLSMSLCVSPKLLRSHGAYGCNLRVRKKKRREENLSVDMVVAETVSGVANVPKGGLCDRV
jgi:hypothetical protein